MKVCRNRETDKQREENVDKYRYVHMHNYMNICMYRDRNVFFVKSHKFWTLIVIKSNFFLLSFSFSQTMNVQQL